MALGAAAAGIGIAVNAHAESRTFEVTLAGGITTVVTVDVPPGTPVDQITLPGIDTQVVSVREQTAQPAAQSRPAHRQSPRRHHHLRHHRRPRHAPRPFVERTAPEPVSGTRPGPAAPADVAPTPRAPGYTLSLPGPTPIGVPNFFIEHFRIPPFLLPIYQAAGIQYGVRWEVLAAINEIETDYGRNTSTSTAGAVGWMQFMPATWKRYGVDANGDGIRDPYNPVDAIFAAGRYLKAAGAATDVRRAVFAYNHAGWYVDSVLLRARLIAGLPPDLVGSLTGLAEGRFPVRARAVYAKPPGPAISIFAKPGSPAVAVQDGRIVAMGSDQRRGRYVVLRDAYGNTYSYAGLGLLAHSRPVAPHTTRAGRVRQTIIRGGAGHERLFAHPPHRVRHGRSAPLRTGSRVVAGTVLGRLGITQAGTSSHLRFRIRPAGKQAPYIDPKPILDGWKLLEATSIYRAGGRNALLGDNPSIGRILLMSKLQLEQRVLNDPHVSIYSCGRDDIRSGRIDRRVLAVIEFLVANGLDPAISALECGHSLYTSSGNISEHSTGDAVDIAAINGIPILGHQGSGSITDIAIRRLLALQGTMKPHQIISLMTFEGSDNTLALPDHDDHIHVGFHPLYGSPAGRMEGETYGSLAPKQWTLLLRRLATIENPDLPSEQGGDR